MNVTNRKDKIYRGLGLFLIACLILTACGPSQSQIDELLAEPVGEPVVVKWLVVGEGTEPWFRSAENDFVTAFNKSQDKIKLEIETGQGYGGISERIEAGNIPDIVGPMSPGFGTRFNELWADIDSLVLEGSGMSDLDPNTLNAWQREGTLVGVPFGFWPSVLYYNKDIFDQSNLPYPPHQYGQDYESGGAWTLDKVAEIGPLLTLDKYGNTARNSSFDPKAAKQWAFMMYGNDLGAAVAIFGSPAIETSGGEVHLPQAWRDAAHWLHNALWEGMFFPNMEGLESTQGDPFGKGQAAMYYVPTWYLCCEVKFNYDLAAVPSFNGKVTARRDHSGFGIPIASQNQEEAMQVIMQLISDPALIAAFRIVPAKLSLRQDILELFNEQNPNVDWQVVVDSINYPDDPPASQFLPRASGVYDRFNQFGQGLLTNEDFAVDDELDKLEVDLQALLQQQ